MNQILLTKSPPLQTYDSFEGAIRGPKEHPLNQAATESTAILAGAKVSDFKWSLGQCSIGFSSGLSLHIKARNFDVEWLLDSSDETIDRYICAPVELVWGSGRKSVFDPGSLLHQIWGCTMTKLFVNEVGLLLYTDSNPILWFSAQRGKDPEGDVLYAFFE